MRFLRTSYLGGFCSSESCICCRWIRVCDVCIERRQEGGTKRQEVSTKYTEEYSWESVSENELHDACEDCKQATTEKVCANCGSTITAVVSEAENREDQRTVSDEESTKADCNVVSISSPDDCFVRNSHLVWGLPEPFEDRRLPCSEGRDTCVRTSLE